jgi:CheY-like chemotaxis protein
MSLNEFFLERAHAEIRQQMDGVLALADQLARQRLTADAQACVTGVAEGAVAVRRLMDSLNELRMASTGWIAHAPAPVRLRDLMDAIQDRWQARALQAEVTLLVSYDGDPDACVMADRSRLLQVFDGYIGEAVAGVRRGAIEVSLRAFADAGGVKLKGRVRGAHGLAWRSQDLDSRVREIDARFGLECAMGVQLAQRVLAELSGSGDGQTNIGAGETLAFELVLPAAIETETEDAEGPARSAHILVVDDNATNRMVAQALVEMFDCTSESAVDGIEAVEAARSGRFDLVLMDIKMPRMDGVTAAREIRAIVGPAGRVPIIALTANADPEDSVSYLAAGMNGVVEKPMKPEHLLTALQEALGGARAAAAA